MNNDKLTNLLKLMILGMAVCGIIIYFVVFPLTGNSLMAYYPEFSNRYWPWLLFLWATGIPCYIVLYYMWNFSNTIKQNKIFTNENVKRISRIYKLAIFDSTFFILGNILLLILNMSHPSILIISLGVSFFGYSISIISYAVCNFIDKGSSLQEECDLTI